MTAGPAREGAEAMSASAAAMQSDLRKRATGDLHPESAHVVGGWAPSQALLAPRGAGGVLSVKRIGEHVRAHDPLSGGDVEVEVTNPVFYDPDGKRLRS